MLIPQEVTSNNSLCYICAVIDTALYAPNAMSPAPDKVCIPCIPFNCTLVSTPLVTNIKHIIAPGLQFNRFSHLIWVSPQKTEVIDLAQIPSWFQLLMMIYES